MPPGDELDDVMAARYDPGTPSGRASPNLWITAPARPPQGSMIVWKS
jgi:hypothetical protein